MHNTSTLLMQMLLTCLTVLALSCSDDEKARSGSSEGGKGDQVTIGTVVETRHDESKKNSPTLLNLDKIYPNQVLTVVIFDSVRHKFPTPPDVLFKDKRIRVTGRVTEYKGRPQIIVNRPEQIEILNLDGSTQEGAITPRSEYARVVEDTSSIKLLCNSPLVFDTPLTTTTSTIGEPLLRAIQTAKVSIDFAVYGVRQQPDILKELKLAKARGVVVRGVVDTDLAGKNYYDDVDHLIDPLINIRTDQSVDMETEGMVDDFDPRPFWPPPPEFKGPPQCIGYSLPGNRAIIAVHASREPLVFTGDLMHDKFFVIDHQIVWMGSCNLSNSCSGGYNANVAGLINSSVIAEWYTREFEQMYVGGKFHRRKTPQNGIAGLKTMLSDGTKLEVFFSPQDYAMRNGVEPAIQNAKSTIDVAVFFLTHKYITADLIKAHQRGVRVRVILDATAAKNEYTKHEILRAAGIPVKVENWGGKMHSKAAVIDGKTLVFGSMNWTTAGERNNDENTIIATSKRLSDEFGAYFEMLWNSIDDRWLSENPDPESTVSGSSWRDGIDNDFDDLIDSADPGTGVNPPPLKKLPPFKIVPKEDGYQLIKGDIQAGDYLYYLPTHPAYDSVKIDESAGEKWFPSIWEAKEAGWKGAR